ncbi:MAG: hypothetical protein J3Q66DRAFT_365027 [Benniella sp.]|nr:MAG: hypothetical protein J3Q66DRAFT_365027 [Benniella sp.]
MKGVHLLGLYPLAIKAVALLYVVINTDATFIVPHWKKWTRTEMREQVNHKAGRTAIAKAQRKRVGSFLPLLPFQARFMVLSLRRGTYVDMTGTTSMWQQLCLRALLAVQIELRSEGQHLREFAVDCVLASPWYCTYTYILTPTTRSLLLLAHLLVLLRRSAWF